MKSKVVYVTSDTVEIFTLHADKADTVVMKMHGPRHPSDPHGKHQVQKNDDVEHFMHEVATALDKDEARILLVGPAQAKDRLKSHIEREHAKLAKNVVGVETMDKSTSPQVIAFGRSFFTKLGAYEAI